MTVLRYLPRFRRASRAMDALAARERWSRSEIEAWQLERLNSLWRHAISHVPYYRDQGATGTRPAHFHSLDEFRSVVPVLPRSAVKDRPGRFLSERRRAGAWHVSSGSTGTPTAFYWGHHAHQEALRCRYRMHAAWGVDIFDRTAFLWSDPAAHVRGWRGVIERRHQALRDRLRGRLRWPASGLAADDLRAFMRRIDISRPAALYAYPTAAYLLAVEAELDGWRPPASLRVSVLSGEPASQHTIENIERRLGVPAPVEYGATECPVIAIEGPDRVLRVREDLVMVETLPAVGGGHELVVTPLGNQSFPLLRYAIGDATDEPLDVPAAGFARLRNVVGRANDLIIARSGRAIHPTRFDFLFGFDLADLVRRYRIHQSVDGSVNVTVEVRGVAPSADVARLREELVDLLEGYPVTVALTDALPASGHKYRWTTSDLSAPPDGRPTVAA